MQATGERDFAELVFEDVEVPVSALLGPMNQGWGVTMSTLGYERAGVIEVSGNLITEIERFLHSGVRRRAPQPARP